MRTWTAQNLKITTKSNKKKPQNPLRNTETSGETLNGLGLS